MATVTLPRSIQRIVDRGIAEVRPEKIVLFGSRARGDANPASDYDLAFFGVTDHATWVHFAAEMIAEPPTLFGLDIMRFEHVSPEMQASILRDGVTLYVHE